MNRKYAPALKKLLSAQDRENARSYHWAAKAMHYRSAGKFKAAEYAEYKVVRSLQRLKRLEERRAQVLSLS